MWILQGSADEQPFLFRLRHGAVKTIGRAPGADLILDAALVSRVHCRLEASDHTVRVVDLSSTNGTFVNGTRISTATLTDGDRLTLGRVELRVSRQANDEMDATTTL